MGFTHPQHIEARCLDHFQRLVEAAEEGLAPFGMLASAEMGHITVSDLQLVGTYPDTQLHIRLRDAAGRSGVYMCALWPLAGAYQRLDNFLDDIEVELLQHAVVVLEHGSWIRGVRRKNP